MVLLLVLLEEEFFNVLVIGFDRDVVFRKGMKLFFLLVMWLFCKKYVEDDVIWKFDDLCIGDLDKKEFFLDIFGSDVWKEMGLIDVFSC